MRTTVDTYRRIGRAFTLVELVLAIGLVAVIATATLGLIRAGSEDFLRASRRSQLLQEGQAALSRAVRTLRQASEFTSVSGPTDTAGAVVFLDANGVSQSVQRDAGSDRIQMGPAGSLSTLAEGVTSLTLTCYDVNGLALSAPVEGASIKSLVIEATLTDPTDGGIQFHLTDRVYWPRDSAPTGLVITELMYNPSGTWWEAYHEWVEVYNPTGDPVDMTGYGIWTGDSSTQDTLLAHASNPTGSLTLAAGGYAVVTVASSLLYDEAVVDGGFDLGWLSWLSLWLLWGQSSGWGVTSSAAQSGSQSVSNTSGGTDYLYYQMTVPPSAATALVSFYERTSATPTQTDLTVTLRDTSNTVLTTLSSGSMAASWTQHTADVSAYAGQVVRLYFSATNSGSGAVFLDSVSLTTADVPATALRLAVDDTVSQTLGGGLDNTTDTVTLVDAAGQEVDSVTYQDSWGADGDGRTLQRVDPSGGSSDAANWQTGPVGGTPGAAN